MVQFFIGGKLVKTHPRKPRGKQTDFADYPPEKIAFHMRTPAWCRKQAADDRPGLRAGHRRPARRQRPLPAPLSPGRHRAWPTGTSPAGSTPPAPGRRPRATRPTGPIKGILAAGTERDQLPGAAGDGGAAAFLHGPALVRRNVIRACPARSRSEAVMPATTTSAGDVMTTVTVTDRSALGVRAARA